MEAKVDVRQLLTKHWLITLFIFLLVFCVGLRFINAGLFHYDSVALASTLENNFEDHAFNTPSGRSGMLLVATVVYYPFYLAGQNADFAVRLTGVLMLALSAVAVYFLAFELTRSRIGALTAALLLAVTPLLAIPSSYGKEHSTAVFFFTLACYCALRSHRSSSWMWPIVAAVAMVWALLTRALFVFGLPAFLWFVVSPHWRTIDGKWRILVGKRWVAGMIALCIIGGIAMFTVVGKFLLSSASDEAAQLVWSFVFINAGLIDFFANVRYAWPMLLVGIYAVWRTGRDYIAPIFLMLVPLLVIPNLVGYYPRYLDIVLVGSVLLVAFAVGWVAQRWIIVAVLFMLFVILSTFWIGMFYLEARHTDNNIKSFAEYVANITEPNAIIFAYDESGFLDYYGHRKGDAPDATNLTELARYMLAEQAEGIPIYVLQSGFKYPAARGLPQFLNASFESELAGKHLLDNYHTGETGIHLNNVSIIRIGKPLFNLTELKLTGKIVLLNQTSSNSTGVVNQTGFARYVQSGLS